MRVISRIVLGATDKAGLTGRTLTDSDKDIDPLELLARFAGYKASPFISIPRELYRGKTAVGEERTPTQTAVRAMLPLVFEDILEASRAAGPGTAALTGALAGVGVGVSTFADSEGRVRRQIRQLREDGKSGEARELRLEFNRKNPDNPIRSVR